MDIVKIYFDWLDGKITDEEMSKVFDVVNSKHGQVVNYIQEAYRDVFIYEDGYEESYSIGD